MARIHHTATVEPGARLADDVEVGPYSLVGPDVELAPDGLVVGVETPRNAQIVKTALELGQDATVTHSLDALSLVTLGNVGTDEGKGNGVETVGEHLVDVIDELAGNAVLVGRETLAEA